MRKEYQPSRYRKVEAEMSMQSSDVNDRFTLAYHNMIVLQWCGLGFMAHFVRGPLLQGLAAAVRSRWAPELLQPARQQWHIVVHIISAEPLRILLSQAHRSQGR